MFSATRFKRTIGVEAIKAVTSGAIVVVRLSADSFTKVSTVLAAQFWFAVRELRSDNKLWKSSFGADCRDFNRYTPGFITTSGHSLGVVGSGWIGWVASPIAWPD